jgi:hypothetical protein
MNGESGNARLADDNASAWRAHLDSSQEALNRTMDRVFQEHHDLPVERVMAPLRLGFQELGVVPDDEWLRPYAEAISAGRRVQFEIKDA